MRRFTISIALISLSIACGGRERINASCQWTHDQKFRLDLTDRTHRTHLRHDADLMEDLAIRYADEQVVRASYLEWPGIRDACMTKLFAVIGDYHGLSEGQIRGWIGRRNVMFDLSVFVSFLAGFGIASGALMRRLFNTWSFRGVLAIIASVAATLIVSAAGGGAGALWAALWEVIRLGNPHVSHRAARLPWPYYLPSLFLAALVVCSFVAVRAHRAVSQRTDLEGASASDGILFR